MEKQQEELLEEEERSNGKRQSECRRKYDKIINQFDQLMDMVEAVTQLPKKRRKTSNRQSKKKSTSTSGAGPIHSVSTANEANVSTEVVDQGDSSKISSPTKAERTSALEEAITKHLSDLQSVQSWESDPESHDS